MSIDLINQSLDEIQNNFAKLKDSSSTIQEIANTWIKALESGNKVIFCGNGGSAADSQHLATELMGRYKLERNPMPSISLTTDTSAITAIGNDYGFDKIFFKTAKRNWEKR